MSQALAGRLSIAPSAHRKPGNLDSVFALPQKRPSLSTKRMIAHRSQNLAARVARLTRIPID